MVDIKPTLRKHAFPYCAREALVVIEQLALNQGTGRALTKSTIHSLNLISDIMVEFIFCETEPHSHHSRGPSSRGTKLNCIQELQLLEILCDYFSYPGSSNEAVRNTVFMSLFPDTHANRARLLIKLVSISISIKSKAILSASGIWMQQLGCTSPYSLNLAKGLVTDYFVLVPKAVDHLQDLPKLAPQFTANFLTAVAELYGVDGTEPNLPPESLLEVVTEWISSSSSLCTAALTPPESALPQGGIPMSPITPFVGLFKWSILSAIFPNQSPLYTRLHLALLESVYESTRSSNVVSTLRLSLVVETLYKLSHTAQPEQLQLALDRLGQAVQVLLAVQCIYGNQEELFKQLDTLPENRLLSLIKTKHRVL